MLKKILEDGVCPDEILNNISDEDKQLIFLEIRKEQIRKYKLHQQTNNNEEFRHNPNRKGKNVGFIDESNLVSILGEREGDKPIEEILAEEALKRAQMEAERQIQIDLEYICNKVEPTKIETPEVKDTVAKEVPKLTITSPEPSEKPINKRISKTAEQKREEMIKRKSTELYLTYIEKHEEDKEAAEKENEELTKLWKKSEEQAKHEEEQRRKLAEEARKLHAAMNPLEISTDKIQKPSIPSKKSAHLRYVINAIQKANMKKSYNDIKAWFLEHEWNNLRIFDGTTDTVPLWFHGMITREEAEQLLENKSFGCFLIRLSDKYQSYVLSYKGKSKIKHVLIESQTGSKSYKFAGPTNVRTFPSLKDLVETFQTRPLNESNSDILKEPCGQVPGQLADYMRILQPDSLDSASTTIVCYL